MGHREAEQTISGGYFITRLGARPDGAGGELHGVRLVIGNRLC